VKDQLAPELVEHLTYLLINSLEGGRLGVGGQLSIRSELGVCDVAVGMGVGQKPMTPWTQHPSFCLAKPLLGLSVGLLIDDGFDPQAQVGTVALHSAGDAINLSCSTFDVLSHQAGLTGPSALQWRILEEDVLPSVLSSVTATDAPRYSDVVGGLVVEAVIRRQTGSDPADWVTRHLLEPMGLDDISVEPGAVGRVIKSGTASVPFGALPADPTPIISELLEVHWARSRLAFGGWTASRSMADLYWNLLEVVRGTAVEGAPSVDVLASLLEPETPDLTVDLTTSDGWRRRWFIEIDRGTEHLPTVLTKCQAYERYWQSGAELTRSEIFPRVAWSVPDPPRAERLRTGIERARSISTDLHRIATTDHTISLLLSGEVPINQPKGGHL
jgi:CubicO group peptidase (beta-lactamase class C family)